MKTNNTFITKNSLFGVLVGLSLILASLVFYITGKNIMLNPQLSNVMMLLSIAGAFIGVRKYREEQLEGFINYSQALGGCIYIITIGSLIYGIYAYALYRYDPELQASYLTTLQVMLDEMYKGSPMLDTVKNMMEHLVSPVFIAATETFNKILTGLIFSLLMAGILRRKPRIAA